MTRKDYAKVAEIIRVAKTRCTLTTYEANDIINFFETSLADMFASDNQRFNRSRFQVACTVAQRLLPLKLCEHVGTPGGLCVRCLEELPEVK